jgi:hypothetical protein
MATQTKKSKTAKKGSKKLTAKEYAKTHCKGLGMVAAIVKLGRHGFDQKEIIAAGYNKNTVYRQYREQVLN